MHRSFSLSGMLAAASLLLLFAAGCGQKQIPIDNPPIINKALYDTASRFYVDFEQYPADMRNLPSGIFDSGTGGLTVLEKLLCLDHFDNITGTGGRDSILDISSTWPTRPTCPTAITQPRATPPTSRNWS